MTNQELRRLSRSELLEMLIAQMEENERLKKRLDQAETRLQDRTMNLQKAGSIAEAALTLNGVFRAADEAVQQYMENIQQLSGRQEEVCREMKTKAEKQASEIVQKAQQYSRQLRSEADAYWKDIVLRAAELVKNQDAIREMMRSTGESGLE